jgi:hypothetical protein
MLIQGRKFNEIVESGDMSGLEMLSQRGQWDECLNLAEKQGPDVLNAYLMKYSKTYLGQGQFKETARTLIRYNCPANNEILPAYKTIAVEVLAMDNSVELAVLKEMLSKMIENLSVRVERSNPHYLDFFR